MASTEAQVAHVWRRLGFGPKPGDVEAGVAAGGPSAVIDTLLAQTPTTAGAWNWPSNGKADWAEFEMWIARLFELWSSGPCQLQERVSWMLSGLLVSSASDFNQYLDLKEHHSRLRGWASAGSYKALLQDVANSTPMQKYLTGIFSAPPHANENLARELMELFSLGVTHPITGAANYTEADIKEIARALTGYVMSLSAPYPVTWSSSSWDTGTKTFLGASRGAAKLPDVINAIAAQDSYKYFVPRRIYRELVGVNPSSATLQQLAAAWGSDGDIKGLIAAIARRPEFIADSTINNRVKSPVELLVSSVRVLGATDFDPLAPNWISGLMRQNPAFVPDVNGWGDRWLQSSSLIMWSTVAYWYAWKDDGTVNTPLGSQNPTVRKLSAEATSATAGDMALRLAGLFDVSPTTRQAVNAYASAGTWNFQRACGTMTLVLQSPEFMVS